MKEIPEVIETLYHCWVSIPDSQCWPDYLRDGPAFAQEIYAFYQGLCLGLQMAEACHYA